MIFTKPGTLTFCAVLIFKKIYILPPVLCLFCFLRQDSSVALAVLKPTFVDQADVRLRSILGFNINVRIYKFLRIGFHFCICLFSFHLNNV